ncbi:hypothetical protein [Lebetimonas sp. JH292]|uniref:hypothetical protein n=1 Tax=Lebetimonas sp. JH292 TaxID=990068 RepID=UPI000467723C|nr:hypothetical protein [Lebetimonas sp. JH292]
MELRKKIALKLKHSKKEIIKLWLEDKEVKEFFDKNNLSLTKFKKGFALGFVNNFIDLIENDVRKCSYLHELYKRKTNFYEQLLDNFEKVDIEKLIVLRIYSKKIKKSGLRH